MRYRFLLAKAKKSIAGTTFLLLAAIAFSGCYKEPEFSTSPTIEFDDISKAIRIDQFSGANKDSVTITVKFQDGDGDLGFNNEEIAAAQLSENYNYVVRVFRKVRGNFVEFQPFIPYSGFFFRLKNDDKAGPIEGTLDYSIDFPHPFTPKRDSVQFQIYLKDRAGNVSNTIETETIVLNEF
ncbi:MAG: hypothetical protein NWP83_05190 [Spirosomaceae bacterium]|nr:hypothetical protein [Spirosomataceae bacterium]